MTRRSSRKQRVSLQSKTAIADSHAPRRSSRVKSVRESEQLVSAKDIRRWIRKVTRQLRFGARDERSQSSRATATESPASSTDDSRRAGVVSRDRKPVSRNHSSSSSSSPSDFDSSLERNDLFSIDHDYHVMPEVTGQGIAGEVRKCVHRRTSRLCAVKTICKDRIRRQDRIYREIAFLEQVDHPNVIALHDVYEEDDEVNIVMEMCHGGELFDKIIEKAEASKKRENEGRQPLPSCFRERDAARIIYSLLSAVSYLHSKDIIHRDIKPENILFTEKDDDNAPIKLIDFGLSVRHPRDAKPLMTTVGTSYYMAPELLRGSYDRACDVWSIGVVAYVMLCGRPPFNGPSDDVIFRKIRRGFDCKRMDNSELWVGISNYAKDFIRCLLVMNPMDRWTADMALEHPWLKIARLEAKSDSRLAHSKPTVPR